MSVCTVAAAALLSLGAPTIRGRQLSNPRIAGYVPNTDVCDHANIDHDQAAFKTALYGSSDYEGAMEIYTKGGFSKPAATVTFGASRPGVALDKGTAVIAQAADGTRVTGKLLKSYTANAETFRFQYPVNCETTAMCQAGGVNPLYVNGDLVTNGCLSADFPINIRGVDYAITAVDNGEAGRTIQGFSTSAKEKQYDMGHTTYMKYYNYYGKYDYANEWVLAALGEGTHEVGRATTFTNGNANFAANSHIKTRGEAAFKGTAYMSIYMYVIREFEDAVDDCLANNQFRNDDPVAAWDEGVAFHAGSMEGTEGRGTEGALVWNLANKRCANFKTCGPVGLSTDSNDIAKANLDLLSLWQRGASMLALNQCAEVRSEVLPQIVSKMAIGPIQGTYRYAEKVDTAAYRANPTTESNLKSRAEGATFWAAIAPMIAHCNAADAETIYNHMKIGATQTDKTVVRSLIEKHYGCLGLQCHDIGGVVDANGEYTWAPCTENLPPPSPPPSPPSPPPSDSNLSGGQLAGVIVGCVLGGAILTGGIVYVVMKKMAAPPTATAEKVTTAVAK